MGFGRNLRRLMIIGAATLLTVVGLLTASGLEGVRKFRGLTKSIRERATQLPLNMELMRQIGELRIALHRSMERNVQGLPLPHVADRLADRDRFLERLAEVELALVAYRNELESVDIIDPRLDDTDAERRDLAAIEFQLHALELVARDTDWVLQPHSLLSMDDQIERLQDVVARMPSRTQERLSQFSQAARSDYYTLIWICSLLLLASLGLIGYLASQFHASLFRPLRVLLEGSRRVASGDYRHRIELSAPDELAELAEGFNAMTRHFLAIRDDLDRQVRERSNEVIRNEQLASVGFLAAGVAHEINNPLATIAWSAESLESRTSDLLDSLGKDADDPRRVELDVIRRYLRQIQEEAFRVKGITDGLLDFSRTGNTSKVETDLRELVTSVVDMARHLGRHRGKRIVVQAPEPVLACVCPQSMKQVVLNLVANALDSVGATGSVVVSLTAERGQAILTVADDGCGMSNDTIDHLFEPFFTLKRDQQGTGLGLAISHRIIGDHQGTIVPRSEGLGRGSTFTVSIPLRPQTRNHDVARQAA